MLRRSRWFAVLTLLGLLAPILPVGVVTADDATVSAPCNEAAFDNALSTAQTNGGGTITFSCGGSATVFFTSQKTITAPNSVVIDGANQITLDGSNLTRHFVVAAGATLELRNITLSNAYITGSNGGSIDNSGVLTITDSVLRDNVVDQSTLDSSGVGAVGGIPQGGAIMNWSSGVVNIARSTFADNLADGSAFTTAGGPTIGGIPQGGAIFNFGMMNITASTFSGNVADASAGGTGGGSFVGGIAQGGAVMTNGPGPLTISNSTFSGNVADGSATAAGGGTSAVGGIPQGGAIMVLGLDVTISSSTITLNTVDGTASGADTNNLGIPQGGGIQNLSADLTIDQTILAGNSLNDCGSIGTWTSGGYNLDSDGSCPWTEPSDISNGDPDLGPLTDNGGPTMTHLPSSDGDAVDNGPLSCLATDQRGEFRPVGPACDIGSVEVQSGSAFVLCADYYTGRVLSPLNGQCNARQYELVVPDSFPLVFCIDVYTGAVSYTFGRPCNPPRQVHVVPDNGVLLTCVSLYTGANRRVINHSQCTPYELPNSIGAL